jgi:hypothetical protein
MTPQQLLAAREREYKKALERHVRALERQRAAAERVQALERELAEAEDEDRRALGEALVDNRKAPARKADCDRAALEKAKGRRDALQYACERAGQELDRLPREHKRDWLRQAQRDFQDARADYDKLLSLHAEARQRLTQEAALVDFLSSGQTSSIRMPHSLRVHAAGVEGLHTDVVVSDVLDALRDELTNFEFDAIRGAHS